jgi:hypothetical protein
LPFDAVDVPIHAVFGEPIGKKYSNRVESLRGEGGSPTKAAIFWKRRKVTPDNVSATGGALANHQVTHCRNRDPYGKRKGWKVTLEAVGGGLYCPTLHWLGSVAGIVQFKPRTMGWIFGIEHDFVDNDFAIDDGRHD